MLNVSNIIKPRVPVGTEASHRGRVAFAVAAPWTSIDQPTGPKSASTVGTGSRSKPMITVRLIDRRPLRRICRFDVDAAPSAATGC